MKGKQIQNLADYNGKQVWVEFQDPNAVSCANCGACGLSDEEANLYVDGVYRVNGHFLVSDKDETKSFHEFSPRITAVYEWKSTTK
jgi:hypothetical protein